MNARAGVPDRTRMAQPRVRKQFGCCVMKLQRSSAGGDERLRTIFLLVGLVLAGARQVGATSIAWGERTLDPYTLGLESPCFGVDISPDNRFVAVYSEDLSRRSKGEATYEIQIWDWRARKIVARK